MNESEDRLPKSSIFWPGLFFQTALGFIGILLGWLLGQDTDRILDFDNFKLKKFASEVGFGLLATLPMIGVVFLILKSNLAPARRLQETVDKLVFHIFKFDTALRLLLLAIAAGVSEEILFRWAIQGSLQSFFDFRLSWLVALLIASIIFGAVHLITFEYFLLASLLGVYLGGIWIATDSLIIVMVAHTAYDFAALLYVVRIRGDRSAPLAAESTEVSIGSVSKNDSLNDSETDSKNDSCNQSDERDES